MNNITGKFIVIDGTDGSGKATQVKLLADRFVREGIKVKTIDFPRYYDNFFGALVGECLAGKHGNFAEVNPHIAAVLYAADRWESSGTIRQWIEDGFVVIADRYVSSNQIHQGGKIKDDDERKKFITWLDKLEFGAFKLPRPDHIFFLSIPISIVQKLLLEKNATDRKKYLEGRGDQHETNQEHLENARISALKMIQESNNWTKIDCTQDEVLCSREEIHEMLHTKVKEILNI